MKINDQILNITKNVANLQPINENEENTILDENFFLADEEVNIILQNKKDKNYFLQFRILRVHTQHIQV